MRNVRNLQHVLALLLAVQAAAAYYDTIPNIGVGVRKSSGVKSLREATEDCAQEDAHLLVIDSEAKRQYATDFMRSPGTFNGAANDRDIWVGVEVNGGAWKTVDGRLLGDIPSYSWCEERPVDGGCVVFSRTLECHWDSSSCFNLGQKLPYICEKNQGGGIC